MSSLIARICALIAVSALMAGPSLDPADPGASTSLVDPMEAGWVASQGLSLSFVAGLDGQGRALGLRLRQSGRIDCKPRRLGPSVLSLSVRVQGSGRRDRLFAMVQDAHERHQMVPFGFLDFKDVRSVTADTAAILQLVRLEKRGLLFYGFYVDKARGSESAIVVDQLEMRTAEPYVWPAEPFN